MPSKSNSHKEKANLVEKKKTQHPFLWVFSVVILLIIVVSFIGAPLLTGAGRNGSIRFGSWNGTPIEYRGDNYFSRQRDMIADRYQSMFQQSDQNVEWQMFQVWNSAFESTVIHTAILEQARKSGFIISEQAVDKALTNYRGYMENGKFSPEVYNNTPNSEKYSIRNYYRESMIHQQWLGDNLSVKSSAAEKAFLEQMSSPERSFRFVAWDLDQYPADEITKYAMKNSDLFSEGNFSRISMGKDKKAAQAVLAELENGTASFEDLAQNHSTDIYAEKGGEMGYVMRYALQSDIDKQEDLDAVFALSKGDHSKLLETPYGFAIYRSNAPVRESDYTLQETQEKIRSYMLVNERGIVEDYFLDKAASFSTRALQNSFTEASTGLGLTEHVSDFFPINYGNLNFMKTPRTADNSSYLQSISSNERILKTLFSLEEKTPSDPQVIGNSILVFQLQEERQAPEQVQSIVSDNYDAIVGRIINSDIRRSFLGSDKLENNFMEVFSKYFLNRS